MQQPDPSSDDSRSDSLGALLKGVPFDLFLVSRLTMVLGSSIQNASLQWQVYELTKSPLPLAFIGIARFIPSITVSLFAGALADVMDRRKILMASQAAPALLSVVLFWLTLQGTLTMTPIYLLMTLVGVASAFETSARLSLLPQVVPRRLFPRAVALTTSVQGLTGVTGPALAGVIIEHYGLAPAYAVHLVVLVLSLISLGAIHVERTTGPAGSFSIAAIKEGLDFLRRRPVVLSAMVLDMFAVIFGGAMALIPIYAADILKVGPQGYGLLRASRSLGASLAATAMTFLPPTRNVGRVLVLAILFYGLSTMAFGVATWFPASLFFYAMTGVTDQVSVVIRQSIVQLGTPDALRGRVSSVNQVFTGASDQLGAVEHGLVASWTNAVFAVVTGGIGTLLSLGIVVKVVPALWTHRVESGEEQAKER